MKSQEEKTKTSCQLHKAFLTIGRSLEIPRGRGVLQAKILEAKYEAKLEFPGGGGGREEAKKLPWGGSMDIF